MTKAAVITGAAASATTTPSIGIATAATASASRTRTAGWSLTADCWNIDTANAIQSVDPSTILANCYARGQVASCAQVHRDPYQHAIDYIDTAPQIRPSKVARKINPVGCLCGSAR
jgi:hypothetical protein